MAGLGADETVELTQTWSAEEVDRIRVVVDEENVVLEANDDDNEAEHGLEVAYAAGFGWKDSYRENPLAWIFSIVGLLLVAVVARLHNARPSTTARAPSTMRKKRPGTRTATRKTTMSTTTWTADSRLLFLSDGQDGARLHGSEIV
ncbi:MAG: hypothetical protein CM15mP128_1340 [Methanobacteriota archaeon]|nr:MAG: hypothetical protein CM15mP128_1340 [Euryarchaeota archaeon]